MANSTAGYSMPDAPSAKSGKTSSIAGVLSSLKRFSSLENIKPHFDLSRHHAPEKRRGPKAGTMTGTMAERRFPVVPNSTESRSSTTRSIMMSDLSESHSQAGCTMGTVTVIVSGQQNMDSNASLIDLSSHRVSSATVLTGEGRRTLRSTRSTLNFHPSPIIPQEEVAPDFPKTATIQPPPQARITDTKSGSSSFTHVAGPSNSNVESIDSTPTPTVTTPATPVLPDLPPKVYSKHPNSSTLTLTKSSTVTKITNFITMEPNNPPAAGVELTPLSTLITQSRNDLRTLRSMNAKSPLPTLNGLATAAPPPANPLTVMGKSLLKTMSSVGNLRKVFRDSNEENVPAESQDTEVKEPEKEVDYDKIEANLDRFEDLYEAFLNLSNADGEQNEEVHLLTVVSKRGEVVRGVRQAGGIKGNNIPERDVVPLAPRPATDCGI